MVYTWKLTCACGSEWTGKLNEVCDDFVGHCAYMSKFFPNHTRASIEYIEVK